MAQVFSFTRREQLAAAAADKTHRFRWLRYLPLAIGAMAMAFGLWTGLERLGIVPFGVSLAPAELHGALMISGFLGTVISLERSVAIGRWWAYGAPAASAAGAVCLLAGFGQAGALAFALAATILLATTVGVALRHFAMFVAVLLLGAVCWMVGAVLWLAGLSISEIAGWWLNFLILTIAAERLELGRLLRLSRTNQILFFGAISLLLIGGARAELLGNSAPFTATGLAGLAVWLIRNDVARRTIRLSGLPRFSAASILAGHVWLGIAALLLASMTFEAITFLYDAVVHAIALGFVMSMIFGHAPIILPAVTGLRVRFHAAAYGPLALLHLSVLLRVIGDAVGLSEMRAVSAALTILSLVGYALVLTSVSWRARLPA